MCLMLCKAGNKRHDAEVYIGADTLCYYFPVLVCWEFFQNAHMHCTSESTYFIFCLTSEFVV